MFDNKWKKSFCPENEGHFGVAIFEGGQSVRVYRNSFQNSAVGNISYGYLQMSAQKRCLLQNFFKGRRV